MNTTSTGNYYENLAAEYLRRKGYEILERNWRTKACEIDIIARKEDVVFHVEVRYRKDGDEGGALESITKKKLAQMKRASEIWCQLHSYEGARELLVLAYEGGVFIEIENPEV